MVVSAAVALPAWIVLDLGAGGRHDLRDFDPHAVARLETQMWRSYYNHRSLKLFSELTSLLRTQYRAPFWRACLEGYHAARAAVVFQKGHNREEYEMALPDLDNYYGLLRKGSEPPFDPAEAARLELAWWIVHRERARHAPGDLIRALAELQAQIYGLPPERFADHARTRAEAMLLRDIRAETGGVSEADWSEIGGLLDHSWTALKMATGSPEKPRS